MAASAILTAAALNRAFILVGQAGGAAEFGHLTHAVGYGPMFAVPGVVLAGVCALAFRLER